jgi:hypothetical protein
MRNPSSALKTTKTQARQIPLSIRNTQTMPTRPRHQREADDEGDDASELVRATPRRSPHTCCRPNRRWWADIRHRPAVARHPVGFAILPGRARALLEERKQCPRASPVVGELVRKLSCHERVFGAHAPEKNAAKNDHEKDERAAADDGLTDTGDEAPAYIGCRRWW